MFLLFLLSFPPLLLLTLYYAFFLPPKYPLNIPAIPFWVTLIPFFRDVDQSETFKRYIQTPLHTHGAVKIFFGARWNVLVHRSEWLAEIFKEEDQWQKSGNQKKIPYSVLGVMFGDNIISAHGPDWKLYRSIIQPGLQREIDVSGIQRHAETLCDQITLTNAAIDGGIPVQDLLQRTTIANTGSLLLSTPFQAFSPDPSGSKMHAMQVAVKKEIFQPIFLNFPFLDRLGLRSRQKAWDAVGMFRTYLRDAVQGSHEETDLDVQANEGRLAARLLQARRDGLITEKQLLDNLVVLYVASQENPQMGLLSTLYLLAKHPEAQDRILGEATSGSGDCPFVTSVLLESLRLFPPIGQLINRRSASPSLLGGRLFIPKGTYLGYNCYSTNRDAAVWPEPNTFLPERWGKTTKEIKQELRARKARAEFISFHGGRRACLGEKYSMLVMRVTLVELLRRFEWTLAGSWEEKMTPAGPLYPRGLRLRFVERRQAGESWSG